MVTTREKIKDKLSNLGTTCMLVGYTEYHSKDMYSMLNLTTNSTVNSHNIIWLDKTYREWKNAKTIISTVEEETIEFPTIIDKTKLTTKAKKILKLKIKLE
jgi:hypothetical protein